MMRVEQLIGSLMTHEMMVESKSDKGPVKGLALKGTFEEEEVHTGMIAKHFEKHFRDQCKNFKGNNFN